MSASTPSSPPSAPVSSFAERGPELRTAGNSPARQERAVLNETDAVCPFREAGCACRWATRLLLLGWAKATALGPVGRIVVPRACLLRTSRRRGNGRHHRRTGGRRAR